MKLRIYPSISEPDKLSTNEILCKAGELIEKVGWNQGALSNLRTGTVCMLGAINATLSGNPLTGVPFLHIKEAVVNELYNRLGMAYGHSLAEWNDTPGRTREQVIGVLKKDC